MTDEQRFSEIADMLARFVSAPRHDITSGKRLYHDLDLTGENYYEFLEMFQDRYHVDFSGLIFSELTSEDSMSVRDIARFFMWLLTRQSRWQTKYMELTVQDFVDLSKGGSWAMSGLADRVGKAA